MDNVNLPISYAFRKRFMKAKNWGQDGEQTNMDLFYKMQKDMRNATTFFIECGDDVDIPLAAELINIDALKAPVAPAFYECALSDRTEIAFVPQVDCEIVLYLYYKSGEENNYERFDVFHLPRAKERLSQEYGSVGDAVEHLWGKPELWGHFTKEQSYHFWSAAAFMTLTMSFALINRFTLDNNVIPRESRNMGSKIGKQGWEYKTLKLRKHDQPATTACGGGGTHAAPRWHIRRGHYRHLKSGKVIWINQMEVGEKTHGGVVKDYLVVVHA